MTQQHADPCDFVFGLFGPVFGKLLERQPWLLFAFIAAGFVLAYVFAGVLGLIGVAALIGFAIWAIMRFDRDFVRKEYFSKMEQLSVLLRTSSTSPQLAAHAYHERGCHGSSCWHMSELTPEERVRLLRQAITDVETALSLDKVSAVSGVYPDGLHRLGEILPILERSRSEEQRLSKQISEKANDRQRVAKERLRYAAVATIALIGYLTNPDSVSFQVECSQRLKKSQKSDFTRTAAAMLVSTDCNTESFHVFSIGKVRYSFHASSKLSEQIAIGAFGRWLFFSSAPVIALNGESNDVHTQEVQGEP